MVIVKQKFKKLNLQNEILFPMKTELNMPICRMFNFHILRIYMSIVSVDRANIFCVT